MEKVKSIADTQAYKISTRLLMQIALKRGYDVSYYPSSPDTQSGITRCEKGGKEFFFKSTCTSLTASFGVHAAENKCLTYSLLAGRVNTPEIVALPAEGSLAPAMSLMEKWGKVVVKPAAMNHGDGVSVGITTPEELERAVEFARKVAGETTDLIVQRQVEGSEYRFLVVSGRVIAVASRRPPFVVGDGTSTVLELIEQKNRDPRRGVGHTKELTMIDIEDVRHHRSEEFLQRVLESGESVNVLDTSNLSRGGESVDFTDIASPAIKKMAVEAAAHCFLGIGGIDIITNDITTNSTEDSYVLEVNLTPGIRMHQFPTVGKPRDVATVIFDEIEKTSRVVGRSIKSIGRAENIALPEFHLSAVPARIDTGARTSAIWASDIKEDNGMLSFVFFDKDSPLYTGKRVVFDTYDEQVVASSNGMTERRYKVRLLVKIEGRKVRASFTLANRASQVYPVLVGRNVLSGKFIVDVKRGKPQYKAEQRRIADLQAKIEQGKETK